MYLSSIRQGYFLVRNGFQNDVDFLHDAIENNMCSKYQHCCKFDVYHSWENLCDQSKRKRRFSLTSYNFCISNLIMGTEMTILVNYSC